MLSSTNIHCRSLPLKLKVLLKCRNSEILFNMYLNYRLSLCTHHRHTLLYTDKQLLIAAGVSYSPSPPPALQGTLATAYSYPNTDTHFYLRTDIHCGRGQFPPSPNPRYSIATASRSIKLHTTGTAYSYP